MSNWAPASVECPTRQVLDRVGQKWTLLVLGLLDERPRRFNELRRDIEGVSQKMLSQTLKALERSGLVHREAFATVPVTVEYSITEMGRQLTSIFLQLRNWSEETIGELMSAERAYDEQAAD